MPQPTPQKSNINSSPSSISVSKKTKLRAFLTSTKIKGLIFGLVVLIGNGIHPIINNSRPPSFDALNFLFQMSLWEFVCAIPLGLYEHRKLRKNPAFLNHPESPKEKWQFYRNLFTIGLIFTGANWLYVVGLEMAGSVSGSIALKTSPLYLLIIGVLFLGEKFDWKQALIVILMLFGLYYLATEGSFQVEIFSLGFGILLLVPLSWAFGHAITQVLLRKNLVTPNLVILVRTGVITFLIFFVNWGVNGWQSFWSSFSNPQYQLFSFLMGFVYFLMHSGWYRAIIFLKLSFASALVTPSPALTALFALLFTDETVKLYQIIGMLIVFTGLYLLILQNRQENHENNQQKSQNDQTALKDAN